MKSILVVYATREGATRRVAEHIAATVRARGLKADVRDVRSVDGPFDPSTFDAVVVAASVHFGGHEKEMVAFVKSHRAALEALPTAFLSVSGSEATAEDPRATTKQREEARKSAEAAVSRFFEQTGWRPERVELVAGALLYTQYGALTRLAIRFVAWKHGTPIDTSHDQVCTDWEALDQFVERLVVSLPKPEPRHELEVR